MHSFFTLSAVHARRPALAILRTALVLLGLAQVSPAAALFGTTTSGTLAFNRSSTFSLILNTFNPNPSMGWVNQVGGIEFSLPAGTYQLDWMTLALRSAINTAQMTFTLYSGNTQPQTALATTTLNLPFTGSTYNLYNVSFPGTVTLSGLQNYFLIGSLPHSTTANSQIDWAGSSPGSPTPDFFGQTWLTGPNAPHGFMGWISSTPSPGPAWQLAVDAAAAPEPALMLLTGAGLVAIGVLRIRRS